MERSSIIHNFKLLSSRPVEELQAVLKEAMELDIPVVIDCQIHCDDKVFPMVSPGAAISDAFDDKDLKI